MADTKTAIATAHTVHTEHMAVTVTVHTDTVDTDTEQKAVMIHTATADTATTHLRTIHDRTKDKFCGSKGLI